MSEKLKRVRFRKDGKLDIEYENEDGRLRDLAPIKVLPALKRGENAT